MAMNPGRYGEELDPFEVRILKMYAEGLWRTQVAEATFLTVSTIKKYEARIRRRLGAKHMIQAMHLAAPYLHPAKENQLFEVNRPQALAFWTLAFRLPIEEQFEITDQDNYGALIAVSNGRRWKLPRGGGVVEIEQEQTSE